MKFNFRKIMCLTAMAISFNSAFNYTETMASTQYIIIGSDTVLKDGQVYMTLDNALAKSISNNLDFTSIKRQISYLEEQKYDLIEEAQGITLYDYTVVNTVWVEAYDLAYNNALRSIESGITQTKQQATSIELATELSIKNMFSSIIQNESSLELAKKSRELDELSYQQGVIKFKYGQISQNSLDQLKAKVEQSDMSIRQLETQIDQLYTNLNNEIGDSVTSRYNVERIEEFVPYELKIPLANFINQSYNSDLSVIIAQDSVNSAIINTKYLVWPTDDSDLRDYEFDLYNARMNLKTLKADKEIAIQDAYNSLAQIEQAYEKALLDLKDAEDNLRLVEINYKAGNTTLLSLKQTELAVMQCENAMEQLIYNYDLQIFMFENSSLL